MDDDILADILGIKFAGNHAADMGAFNRIQRFVNRKDLPREDRQKAWDHMVVEGMGMDPEPFEEVAA